MTARKPRRSSERAGKSVHSTALLDKPAVAPNVLFELRDYCGLSTIAAKGGRVSSSEAGRPCDERSLASTP